MTITHYLWANICNLCFRVLLCLMSFAATVSGLRNSFYVERALSSAVQQSALHHHIIWVRDHLSIVLSGVFFILNGSIYAGQGIRKKR